MERWEGYSFGDYAPVVVNPGETKTIHLTITPSAGIGTT